MDHIINIYQTEVGIHDGEQVATFNKKITTFALSDDWFDLTIICSVHILSVECNCKNKRTHLWSINNDLHRRFGEDVRERARRAIEILSELDINIISPDANLIQTSRLDRLGIFLYHLNKIYELAKSHPTDSFIVSIDDDDHLLLSDGRTVQIKSDNYTYVTAQISTIQTKTIIY